MNIDFDFGCYDIMTVSVTFKLQSLLLNRLTCHLSLLNPRALNVTIVKQNNLIIDLRSSIELVARQ